MSNGVQYENPEGAPPAQGLYSHLTRVKAGELIFIAGQLAVGAKGEVVGVHSFEEQFQCVFDNLGMVLKSIGLDYNDIIKFNTFLVHSQDIPKFMTYRLREFPKMFAKGTYPPNTLLMVDRLVKEEFLVEVQATAAL